MREKSTEGPETRERADAVKLPGGGQREAEQATNNPQITLKLTNAALFKIIYVTCDDIIINPAVPQGPLLRQL